MKLSSYLRVSTDDADQDPQRQLLPNQQYADLHGHEIVNVIIEYHGGDSDPDKRPEFSKVYENGAQGVIVTTIDRFSREHPNTLMNRLSDFKKKGFMIISVREPIFNMESEFAEPMQYFLTWWNNQFLKKLSQDTKEGIERARRDGKQIGRPDAQFNRHRAFHLLFVEKKSQRYVSKELGVSLATINRFKKGHEKNPELFINQTSVSETSVFVTQNGDVQ